MRMPAVHERRARRYIRDASHIQDEARDAIGSERQRHFREMSDR